MSFIEDAFSGALAAYIDISSQAITYNDGINDVQIKATVSGAPASVGGGDGRQVSSTVKEIFVRVTDLPASVSSAVATANTSALKTHRVTVDELSWKIFKAEPDDEGGAVLKLKRA